MPRLYHEKLSDLQPKSARMQVPLQPARPQKQLSNLLRHKALRRQMDIRADGVARLDQANRDLRKPSKHTKAEEQQRQR